MNLPEPEHVFVAREDEVEPLLRAARAEVARLSLHVRSANHDADALEAALLEDQDTSELALLRTSLDELIEHRSAELEAVLEQELVRVASMVAVAQHEAATDQSDDLSPTRRLQVVGAAPQDDGEDEDVSPPASRKQAPVRAMIDAPLAVSMIHPPPPLGDAPLDPIQDAPLTLFDELRDEAAPPEDRHEPPPNVEHEPLGHDTVGDPQLLRELVTAAVTAAVVATHSSGTAHASAGSAPWIQDHQLRSPDADRRRLPPLGRRVLHVDVILPLLLVVIVFVVLLAWVG